MIPYHGQTAQTELFMDLACYPINVARIYAKESGAEVDGMPDTTTTDFLPSICGNCDKPFHPGDHLIQNNDDGRIVRCVHFPQGQHQEPHHKSL